MGSLFEESEAREAAARVRVEALEAEVAALSGKPISKADRPSCKIEARR